MTSGMSYQKLGLLANGIDPESPLALSALDPADLPLAEILRELALLGENLPRAREELVAARQHVERVAQGWEQGREEIRRTWGEEAARRQPVPPEVAQARELAGRVAARLAAWEGRRAALLAALPAHIDALDAACVPLREAIAAEERALAEHEARVRELTAALVEVEGYETTGGVISYRREPLIGRTATLRHHLELSRRALRARQGEIASARYVLAELERADARERALAAVTE